MAEDMRPTDSRSRPRAGRAAGLAGATVALVVLFGLHPVLDTLGRHPEFFAARSAPRRDAVVVAATLAIAVPAVVWALVWTLERWLPRSGFAAGVFMAGSGAVFAMQAAPSIPTVAAVAGAAVGALLSVGLASTPRAWRFARWGVVVPLLSFAFFVAIQPVSRVVWGSTEVVAARSTGNAAPVVLVVFDELPTATLMEAPDRINADRYPNFAAFADDAIWYRNATAVSDHTSAAVPAVLTGMRVPEDALPIAADHPQSIYTLLSDSHDLHVVEPVTALCPAEVCGESDTGAASSPTGVGSLIEDVRIVGMHVLLPEAWTTDLPPIDQTWGGFEDLPAIATEAGHFDLAESADASALGDRRRDFDGVIQPPRGNRPPAYILHTMLPHVPYRYLPTGQQTLPVKLAGLVGHGRWGDDPWLAEHAHRRHLLQTGLADRLLGEVLDELRKVGLYDEAVIAVVADHGVAFRPGHPRRDIDEATLPDVAAVPMFLRYPNGPRGLLDTRPVETVDLVPTITDLLDIEVVQPFDGTSLLDDRPRPDERAIRGVDREISFTADEADPWTLGRTVVDRFGRDWEDLYASVPNAALIGQQVTEIGTTTPEGLVTVDHRDELRDHSPASDPIVGVISGGLAFAEPRDEHLHVAIAFDGTIVAVGRTIELLGDTAPFHALIDPAWYAREVEPITVYQIAGEGPLKGPMLDPDAG